MAKSPSYPTLVLGPGMGKFVFVNEPQEPFEGKGKPQYKTRVLLEDTQELRDKIDAWLEKVAKEAKANKVKLKKNFKSPFEYPEDQDEDDFIPEDGKDHPKLDEDHQGKIFFTAKTQFQPGLIDSTRASLPEDVKIMSGDTIRVKVEGNPYEGFGSGISLRLKTVQLVEKSTSYNGGEGYTDTDGFDDIDGYVAGDQVEGSDGDEEDEDF